MNFKQFQRLAIKRANATQSEFTIEEISRYINDAVNDYENLIRPPLSAFEDALIKAIILSFYQKTTDEL